MGWNGVVLSYLISLSDLEVCIIHAPALRCVACDNAIESQLEQQYYYRLKIELTPILFYIHSLKDIGISLIVEFYKKEL